MPDDNEDDSSSEDDNEGTQRVTVCHKPGTPAEQNLVISPSAVDAHLGHGDYEGPCDINFGPVPEEEVPDTTD